MARNNLRKPVPVGLGLLAVATATFFGSGYFALDRPADRPVMLVLRGVANQENPRGQLDDQSALEYARRSGYRGEVLDVAGDTGGDSPQVKMALSRIREDAKVTALYGFSGGGYNTRTIWKQLNATERERIRRIVIIGSPGVAKADFPGITDVLIKVDPPAGHMAGPKVLLDSLGPS
jgi:hypothetical protein